MATRSVSVELFTYFHFLVLVDVATRSVSVELFTYFHFLVLVDVATRSVSVELFTYFHFLFIFSEQTTHGDQKQSLKVPLTANPHTRTSKFEFLPRVVGN